MDIHEIISKAPVKMRGMLESVYNYNLVFAGTKEQKELLKKIILAMSIVDRKFFSENEEFAYLDMALGIGKEQTISQPSTVARMLMLAELKKGDSVIEIGTGSGWNASLISFLVYPGKVVSLDIYSELVERAGKNIENIKRLNKDLMINLNVIQKSIFGYSGGKFDKVIFSAGIIDEQEEEIEKISGRMLNKNGILICPRKSGKIIIFKKNEKLGKEETKEEYVFVPLLE